jgi:hypothetical protein
VLVFGGVHVGTQLVGRCPEGLFDVVEHEALSFYDFFDNKCAGR